MKEKSVAAILALLGGGFGLHKFYLGNITAGILYLVLAITGITFLIAFFEFFGLLFMSQRRFDAIYNTERYLRQQDSQLDRESVSDRIAIIYQLKKLYDDGIITAEEFEEKRRKFLNSI